MCVRVCVKVNRLLCVFSLLTYVFLLLLFLLLLLSLLQTEYGEGGKGYSKMVMDVELTDQGKDEDNQLQSSGDEEEDNNSFEYGSRKNSGDDLNGDDTFESIEVDTP